MRIKFITVFFLFTAFMMTACGSNKPVDRLKKSLDQYPEYSIILEDMRQEGTFFTKYYHRYKTVFGTKENPSDTALTFQSDLTDWMEVNKKEFLAQEGYLGMVIASKSADGKIHDDKYPPGYQYVGNQKYGNWRSDGQGGSFWEWYGKYALMSSMFNMFNRPVYQSDWRDYNNYRRRGTPYYGSGKYYGSSGNMYGTQGRYTKQAKPNFYQRRSARQAAQKSSFGQKVQNRVKRSNMSGVRGRSSSRGGK